MPVPLRALEQHAPDLPLAVALSGGADSSAMLVACAQLWPGQVKAVHIHHGLQAAADDFADHCQQLCDTWQVPLVVQHVLAQHALGESPEEAARQARYQAFQAVLPQHWGGEVQHLVLAQHADDQAETVLLALSRGAGLAGLSAMPVRRKLGQLTLHRPWLGLPSQALREWLIAQSVPWCEDPTNRDLRFTRNRIRLQLMPLMQQLFPALRSTLARTAAHAAQAQTLLAQVAAQDLLTLGQPPALQALQALSPERMTNVLHHWLKNLGVRTNTAQLQELVHQVKACTTRGHQLHLKVGHGHVRRQGNGIDWYNS